MFLMIKLQLTLRIAYIAIILNYLMSRVLLLETFGNIFCISLR